MSERPEVSEAEATRPLFAGVDLGGTNVKLGLVDDRGRTLAQSSFRTESERGPEDGARRMGQGVLALASQAGIRPEEIARVGLASPGTMDIPAGMLIRPHNLPGWFDFPIRERVSHHCGRPVTYTNDANAAAYGEFWVGSGRDYPSLVLFTLGTGIGCGIIIGDLSIEGEHSHGAECGHMIIDYHHDARMCGCGQRGHLEAYASAVAVIKRTQEALAAGRASSLERRRAAGEELTPLVLAREAEHGDGLSLEIILDTARFLGIGAVNLMHTIDPKAVILGGAMTFGGHGSELGRRFLDRVRQEIQQRAFPVPARNVVVDFATLGGDAGYIGSAGIARLEHRRREASGPRSEASGPPSG
jgi:glucokinase